MLKTMMMTLRRAGAAVILGVLVMFLGAREADPQTSVTGPTGPASATVPTSFEFTLSRVVRMNADAGESDPFLQGTILASPSFDFGTLRRVTDAQGNILYMRGQYYYYVLMIAATSGRRYKISESGTDLIGPGGNTLPHGSVLLIPDYQWLDELGGLAQGGPPAGASVGPVTSASGTDSLVYQSETAGRAKLLRAILAVSGPPAGAQFPFNFSQGYNGSTGQGTQQNFTGWAPITPDQAPGTYTSTVTFTLVLN